MGFIILGELLIYLSINIPMYFSFLEVVQIIEIIEQKKYYLNFINYMSSFKDLLPLPSKSKDV